MPLGTSRARAFFEEYTHGLTTADLERMFTRDTPEAYHYFARSIDFDKLGSEPWYRRWLIHARLFFIAFTMRLSPARRVLYAVAWLTVLLGLISLFRGFALTRVVLFPLTFYVPLPAWAPGTTSLLLGFFLVNLLVLMEVADRLSLKSDLEVARDIQLAMLPSGLQEAGDAVVCGLTRPANTVGGDFYDVLRGADGRLVLALGDVAGKGSPAALLMALLLAMLRTLVDEGLQSARLLERLNVQVERHSPASRFITLFYALYDPRDGSLEYVNAGHLPPIVRRVSGELERLTGGGIALGMFDHATYEAHRTTIAPGEALVLFSDGITEAENRQGRAFEEAGLGPVISDWVARGSSDPEALGRSILSAVEAHAGDSKLADDLTVLVLTRRAAA